MVRSCTQLLKAGASPELRGMFNDLPLTLAVRKPSAPRSTAIVKALLQAGANPHAYSLRGAPILCDACRAGGNGLTVQLLVQAGAGVNVPCLAEDFFTPRQIANRGNYTAAMSYLGTMSVRAETRSRLVRVCVGGGETCEK